MRTFVPPGVSAMSFGELEPIWSLRAKRTWSNWHQCSTAVTEDSQLAIDDRDGSALVQWLVTPATNLAHHEKGQHREDETDGQEDRTQGS